MFYLFQAITLIVLWLAFGFGAQLLSNLIGYVQWPAQKP